MTPWDAWRAALSPFLPAATEAAVGARETCSCGAHTRIDGTDWVTALAYLEAWRRDHRHEMRPEMLQREGGAGSYVERAEIGFVGGDCA